MPGRPPLLTPSGTTRVAAVIGDPVAHSLSPKLHNAAYAATGLDWVYVALPVAAGRGGDAVRSVAALGLAGLSVTMPHKPAAAAVVDELTPTAGRLGAVNTVVPLPGGRLLGDSTDGGGLLDALRRDGADPAGWRVAVLGAGGAAAAAVDALASAGARSVTVVARRADAAAATAALAGAVGHVGPVDVVGDCDLVVDATSAGMQPGAGLPLGLEPAWLAAGQLVVDMVYSPAVTPLLDAARARGATARNGLGMLVHQAARQFTAFTGQPAPIEAMLDAVGA